MGIKQRQTLKQQAEDRISKELIDYLDNTDNRSWFAADRIPDFRAREHVQLIEVIHQMRLDVDYALNRLRSERDTALATRDKMSENLRELRRAWWTNQLYQAQNPEVLVESKRYSEEMLMLGIRFTPGNPCLWSSDGKIYDVVAPELYSPSHRRMHLSCYLHGSLQNTLETDIPVFCDGLIPEIKTWWPLPCHVEGIEQPCWLIYWLAIRDRGIKDCTSEPPVHYVEDYYRGLIVQMNDEADLSYALMKARERSEHL